MESTKQIVPIVDVEDIDSAADSLHSLMRHNDNSDLTLDFPRILRQYSESFSSARRALRYERDMYVEGRREMYAILLGEVAVGLGIVIRMKPGGNFIDDDSPNLSGFVCWPYRGTGLGRLSLNERIRAVNSRFGSTAWTEVRDDNYPSIHLVESLGFKRSEISGSTSRSSHIYVYENKKTTL